ncbi:MAG: threonine ammonia-lyase [Vicinamibacteraceae bacterium]
MTDSTRNAANVAKLDISLAGIEEAAKTIDPVFTNTPQFVDEQLSAALGRHVLVKVETTNPVRSFKGRGADFMMQRLEAGQRVVCSSTGNFGQAMAYAGRRRGIAVDVFVPVTINPVKLARMNAFGARVTTVGRDSAESQEAARDSAASSPGCVFIQDGKAPEIAEGAGTIGVELLQASAFDTIVLPVGDGALISGVARWIKAQSPMTRFVGVCASGAPSMVLSWRAARQVSTERSDTIAEGIEVRSPTPEAVARLHALVDDMVVVDDSDLVDAVRLAFETLGLLLEPAGAAGLAAIRVHNLPGERLATVLTGSNLRPELLRRLMA